MHHRARWQACNLQSITCANGPVFRRYCQALKLARHRRSALEQFIGSQMPKGKSGCSAAAIALALSLLNRPCTAQQHPDTGFANFAFATELGSGVYGIAGQTIQVYQIPLSFTLRPAQLQKPPPGINLLLPMTVGFYDFNPNDLLHHLQIPTHLGAFSVEPGIQLDYWLTRRWHLYPYAKAGVTAASASTVTAVIYGLGVRSDYQFDAPAGTGLWRAELAHASVRYGSSSVPNDSFTRLRNGATLRYDIGVSIGERRLQIAPYDLIDMYFDAPSGPASGISAHTIQFESGLLLGLMPMWQILGIELPRLGFGYRVAGELSGWRLVIGEPF
jgi:hypothetical protein